MTKYQLRIFNASGTGRRFYFFTAPPKFSGDVAPGNIYTNTWVSIYVANNSPATVTTELDFYAFCGPKQEISGKTTITTGSARMTPATLGRGTTPGSSYKTFWDKENQNFRWADEDIPDEAIANCYSITTDHEFTLQDKCTIGMAMMKEGDDVATPVAVVDAQPGMKYNISPVVKFYVATGDRKFGEVFDFVTESTERAEYDFSASGGGKGFNSGDVTYDAHGAWSKAKYKNQVLLAIPSGAEPSASVDWLYVFVKFTKPILVKYTQELLYAAARNALEQLKYNYGPFEFSSDGKTLIIKYELPFKALGDEDLSVSPWYPRPKPDSEVFISLDAKNEIVQVKFTPCWQKIAELTNGLGNASLAAAVPQALVGALNAEFKSIGDELPGGESWVITG